MGETIRLETRDVSVPTYVIRFDGSGSFWRRAWFLMTCVPRYLLTGDARLP